MKLSLGFSPCPNDTFIFDAMVHQKVSTGALELDVYMGDVEDLNRKALKGELDITKISYHAYPYLMDKYVLLDAGSALGKNCGPLLIAKNSKKPTKEAVIGIPGRYTTANYLLSLAYPKLTNKKEMLFSEIEEAVLSGQIDAGLIIHENRFTYEQKGLKKIIDLGEYWEEQSSALIPLGGIAIRRDLPNKIKHKVNRILKKSVEYALRNPMSSKEFVKMNARELEHTVIYSHIDLYVNEYTVELGEEGRKAVRLLFQKGMEKKIIPDIKEEVFFYKFNVSLFKE